jgi:flavin-dependent dehydrogenase
MTLDITLFDAKNFLLTGPAGCNLCAGVISENLYQLLQDHGIELKSPKVQWRIEGYYLQTPLLGVQLHHPNWRQNIYSVFRGNGPRFSSPEQNVSFDDLLLQHVIRMGAKHKAELVVDVHLPRAPDEPALIETQDAGRKKVYEVDLIVGAFGLNSHLIQQFARKSRYSPPRIVATFQAEFPLPQDWIEKRFRGNIVVFSFPSRRTRYVVVVPKRGYLSISIINRRDAEKADLERFLRSPLFRDYLPSSYNPPEAHFCICKPRIAVSCSRHPYSHRMVIIGDAGYTRIFKNGIESAYYSSLTAARAAIEQGVSSFHFRRYYARPMRRWFVRDNRFGRITFFIYDFIVKHTFFSRVLLQALVHSPASRWNRYLKQIIWNLFTGRERYEKIFWQFVNPLFQLFMLVQTWLSIWHRSSLAQPAGPQQRISVGEYSRTGPLQDGSTVAIVGGGPGGIACALTLRRIARSRNLNIHIVLYEGKTYTGVPHYNQCVGVLSPPIRDLLERELGIAFPDHLVQRIIRGYYLFAENESITLDEKDEISYAVRRITFDEYLMQKARERGIEIRHSRVTDVEIQRDQVILYSETDSLRADVIVGAFGLDDGSIQLFERATEYRAPDFLYSIVTKIHPGMEYMRTVGERIFAFLPPMSTIEFGAVTPKYNHITINIAGRNIDANAMDEFLRFPPVRRILPPGTYNQKTLYYFKGKFPVSVARNFYGHRYVMIGDAAGLVRPFKGKGINSAILTGIWAAQTMMNEGISKAAFRAYEESCAQILNDLPYGHFMRRVAISLSTHGLMDFFVRFARQNRAMQRALFDSVSAHRYYRNILLDTLRPAFFREILRFGLEYVQNRRHS